MRREHTLKVCANHVVDSCLSLAKMAGSDKAWSFVVSDWSGINEVGEHTGEVREMFVVVRTYIYAYACVCMYVCVHGRWSGINEAGEHTGEVRCVCVCVHTHIYIHIYTYIHTCILGIQ